MLANIVYIGENIAQSANNITLKPNLKSRVTMIAVSSIERHIYNNYVYTTHGNTTK